jgi:hypothetical protein
MERPLALCPDEPYEPLQLEEKIEHTSRAGKKNWPQSHYERYVFRLGILFEWPIAHSDNRSHDRDLHLNFLRGRLAPLVNSLISQPATERVSSDRGCVVCAQLEAYW